jgi:hypothetical protein
MGTMDKSQWNKISEEIAEVLTKVAKKHGVTFESSGFTYGEQNCVLKTTATVNDASGLKKDLERETFITWATKYLWLANCYFAHDSRGFQRNVTMLHCVEIR